MILVINAGSSSIKFKLFTANAAIASGSVECIGEMEGHALLMYGDETISRSEPIADHKHALGLMLKLLQRSGRLPDVTALEGIGHRVVHGGETFRQPARIDKDVVAAIEALIPLAPLHNPANLEGIRAMTALMPRVPQIAVFDTAFHTSLPPEAYHYALPAELYKKYGIRRYGFHGTSHAYVTQQAATLLGKSPETLNLISLHLGNGASACAIRDGKSIETSMGFTPLEGLVMGTRSGDLDPGILSFLLRDGKMNPDGIDRLLNRESGLKGICGFNDMRQIESAISDGDQDARLAFDIFVHRLQKYIGSYAVLLDRVDAIVFTGGIGENSIKVREAVCTSLGILGVSMDTQKNRESAPTFQSKKSRIALLRIPTDEERAIANILYTLLRKKPVLKCD